MPMIIYTHEIQLKLKGVEKNPPRLIFDILKVKFDIFRHIFKFGP